MSRPAVTEASSSTATFGICLVAIGVMLPVSGDVRDAEMIAAFVLLALVGALLGFAQRAGRWVAVVGILLFLGAVALLRDATPATGGYSPLVLLPVIWAATRGQRVEIVAAMIGGVAVFAVPLILVGAPQYPAAGWRTCALTVFVGWVVATRVTMLVARLRTSLAVRRRHEEATLRRADGLAAIAEVTRVVGHSDPRHARATICQVARAVADATTAAIWEADAAGELHVTCMLGAEPPSFGLRVADGVHGACAVMRQGRALFVADAVMSDRVDVRMAALLGCASAHFQPIEGPEGARGVLALSWSTPIEEPASDVALLLEVLASEAATAFERGELLDRLEALSRTDELTGLPNRRAWDELLTREIAAAARTGRPLSVALLDLDHFKNYNDWRGHLAGDRLLVSAASAWSSRLRATDLLARWGGEEFVMLLPGCAASDAAALVERMRGLLPDEVTFSAGVAEWDGVVDGGGLLGAADAALYEAKRTGRDRVAVAGRT